jgi:hypothetical protein
VPGTIVRTIVPGNLVAFDVGVSATHRAPESDLVRALRERATSLPEVSEGVACAGTALESRTAQVRKKAFLFLGKGEARLKLRESLPEALHWAAKDPARFRVGSLGWVAVTVAGDDPAVREVCLRWVEESYRLMAPQAALEALAPAGAAPAPQRAKQVAKKPAAKQPVKVAKKSASRKTSAKAKPPRRR